MKITYKKVFIILAHAFVIWALCGATIGIGRVIIGIGPTLIVHLFAAPIFSALISLFYYKKFNFTMPFTTALIFLFFVGGMDAGLVAPVFERSFSMFTSVVGTWIPFGLIFLASYTVGLVVKKQTS